MENVNNPTWWTALDDASYELAKQAAAGEFKVCFNSATMLFEFYCQDAEPENLIGK